eukprot:TRINITY_DN23733_c0_g1_i1.p1 TRINITY_DN23733_c0_g1~~TRINITY_DN23733_c0_g1_i1.p1  ORF type:complete len:377 (+),score=94.38 TRINITY_DN23733_c0_g1_i1:29-1132(+)
MGRTSEAVEDIAIICGALSTLGGLAVLMTSVLIPELRRQLPRGRMLLLLLSACDMCQGIVFMFTGTYNKDTGSASCIVMGSAGIMASVSSFIATGWVAWWVHHTILHPTESISVVLPFVTTIGYPIVSLAGLFIYAGIHWHGDGIGWRQVFEETQDFPWCFIADHPSGDMFIWRVVVEYAPLIVSMIVTSIYYVMSIMHIKKQAALQCIRESSEMIALERKFLIIIVAYIIIRMPGVIARLYSMGSSNDHVAPILQILTVLGDPSQGFVNGVVFTLGTRVVRDRLTSLCYTYHEPDPDTPPAAGLNHKSSEVVHAHRPKSLVLTGQRTILAHTHPSLHRPLPAPATDPKAESAPLLGEKSTIQQGGH